MTNPYDQQPGYGQQPPAQGGWGQQASGQPDPGARPGGAPSWYGGGGPADVNVDTPSSPGTPVAPPAPGAGDVTVGNIGSSERHNYSAIGDAVNVAARVEGLTKDLGRKIIITEAVVSRIEERFHFDPLGSHKVKGHSPVNVWGIRTVRTAPAAVEAEAVQ